MSRTNKRTAHGANYRDAMKNLRLFGKRVYVVCELPDISFKMIQYKKLQAYLPPVSSVFYRSILALTPNQCCSVKLVINVHHASFLFIFIPLPSMCKKDEKELQRGKKTQKTKQEMRQTMNSPTTQVSASTKVLNWVTPQESLKLKHVKNS